MILVDIIEHLVLCAVLAAAARVYWREGREGLLRAIIQGLRVIPGVNVLIRNVLAGEVKKFTEKHFDPEPSNKVKGPPKVPLPKKGVPHQDILEQMIQLKAKEKKPEDGKMFALVYTGETESFELQQKAFEMFSDKTGLSPEHDTLVNESFKIFMHENALNPMAFPSLRQFENEVITMTASFLNGDSETVGSITSGGTESILMAMKAYRDRARQYWPQIKDPEMVAPTTIHPAHEKAASYFGFRIIYIPLTENYTPNMRKFKEAIGPNTIALLASAPQYPHGIVDPIEEIADLAIEHHLPLHVDACFGGFMLPWVEKLGYPVPPFDFRVPGVTSISADIHKYGYGAKGASVVLYKNTEYRKFQIFSYSQWPGGLFGSPSMAGTRPGGNIAASWAALKTLGEEGYMSIAREVMETTEKLKDGIWATPGLCILGNPHMTAFAIGSCDPDVSIMAVADMLEEKGWSPERNQYPDSIHCTIMPVHAKSADTLIKDLGEAARLAKKDQTLAKKGTAAMYGMVAQIPDKTLVDEFTVEFFSEVFKI